MRNPQKLRYLIVTLFTQFVFLVSGVLAADSPTNAQEKTSMKLESSSFKHNDSIPIQYTGGANDRKGEGPDLSPPLNWTNVPKGTKSLALICEDPDAPKGVVTHWVLYNLPPTLSHIEEGGKSLPSTVGVGKNTRGNSAYKGPMPPTGVHHYHFTLYALDTKLELKEGATKEELKEAMKGHILADVTLTGLYQLQKNK